MTVTGTTGTKRLLRRRVLGLDFVDTDDMDRVVEALMAPQPDDSSLPLIVTPNVDDLVKLQRPEYSDLADLTRRARYVLPDGQPVVWASRWLGTPLSARLTGADLLPRWWAQLVADRRATMVIAPDQGVAEALQTTHPELVTVVAPRLDVADASSVLPLADAVAERISHRRPEAVMTGIGFPHQQRLAHALLHRLDRPWPLIALLGGSFDLFTGRTHRAPAWMRDHGLEWAYRLATDPRRLARRYLVDDVAFLPLLWRATFGSPR